MDPRPVKINEHGLPTCQTPHVSDACCDDCFGMVYDGDGSPLCLSYVRDAIAERDRLLNNEKKEG